MARHEADREDLIRDAVAFRNRIEWLVPGELEPVVTGLRSDQSLSVFFGQDPVYHFNPDGQLRRAYVAGFLYRTQGDTLARLSRERSESETTLLRSDLKEASLRQFQTAMRTRIAKLRDSLKAGSATALRSVLESGTELRFPEFLARVENASPWLAPAIPTRRK